MGIVSEIWQICDITKYYFENVRNVSKKNTVFLFCFHNGVGTKTILWRIFLFCFFL